MTKNQAFSLHRKIKRYVRASEANETVRMQSHEDRGPIATELLESWQALNAYIKQLTTE
jgi:hypothetical protein